MARRLRWKVPAIALSLAVVAALGASAPGAASADGRGPDDDSRASASLEAASTAIPTVARPLVTDATRSDPILRPSGGKAVSTATATSGCDGCSGTATTLQTVRVVGNGAAVADNVAAAWSSCAGCSSTAVSVQIITGPRASAVVVNNRSLAVNVACVGCRTTAVALQFVIIGGSQRELSAETKALIQQIEQELGLKLSAAKAVHPEDSWRDEAKKDVDDAANRAKAAIVEDTRAPGVTARVEVDAGD
ncbi:hypothetical protein [Sinomonas sp. G460-2]|uniref:hypothetical protein n=1 Tax=Sinomonas sp. G460-2 TaxID=3393464 RepID=UPI0039EE6162